jgi:ribonuclease HI
MKVYCDSSVTEACVVLPSDPPYLFPYHERVTTNQGEYLALLHALDLCLDFYTYDLHIEIYSDSQLIVNQTNSLWRCRDPKLIPLRNAAQSQLINLNITLHWIPREQNLAGIVLEQRKKDETRLRTKS